MPAKTVVMASAALFALTALFYALPADAADRATRGGYPACETQKALLEAVAARREDASADLTAIDGCIMTEADLSVNLLRADLLESKVRVKLSDGTTAILWTENNNIKWGSAF